MFADELEILKIPKERITRVIMQEKIKVGFTYDKEGQIQTEKNGEPIFKQEITIDWACSELDKIFYNGLIEIPHSDLFLKEFPEQIESFKDSTVLIRGSHSLTVNKVLSKMHFDFEPKTWLKTPAMALVLEHIYGV